MKTQLLPWSMLVLGLAFTSCSKGPAPPQPGTPAFLWNGAQTTWHAGDMVRADENLQQLVRTDNEFAARARPWAMVVAAGLTQGYTELADTFDAGAKMNRANPMPFRKQASALRSMASTTALEFAEAAHQFQAKDTDPNVLFAFDYPSGTAAQPPGMAKVSGGVMVQEAEAGSLQSAMGQRGVLMTLCRLTGNPDDTAKTLEKMKGPEVRIPRATLQFAVAKLLFEQSALFGGTKLDRPDRLKVMCDEALEMLKGVPENKDTKQLTGKIQAALKKIRAT